MRDELYVRRAQAGDRRAMEYLLSKYRYVVLHKTRGYYMPSTEREDMIQEGMLGLYKAIRDFQPDRNCSFGTFASMCITRQMITAVKSVTSNNKQVLTRAAAVQQQLCEAGSDELFRDVTQTPEDTVLSATEVDDILDALRVRLSRYEWSVFRGFADGQSYQEIAQRIGSTAKSVDNALTRTRRKLEQIYRERVAEFNATTDFTRVSRGVSCGGGA